MATNGTTIARTGSKLTFRYGRCKTEGYKATGAVLSISNIPSDRSSELTHPENFLDQPSKALQF